MRDADRIHLKYGDMKMKKAYKLIPMTDITEDAKNIAVLWVENYRPMGYDLPGKHKLASDIMNYAINNPDMTLIERAFLAGRSKTSWGQFKKDFGLSEVEKAKID